MIALSSDTRYNVLAHLRAHLATRSGLRQSVGARRGFIKDLMELTESAMSLAEKHRAGAETLEGVHARLVVVLARFADTEPTPN